MDYTAETSGPTTQIENIMAPAVNGKTDANAVVASLSPFEQQRDMIVGHVVNDYNALTNQAILTKNRVDSANELRHYLKDADGKKTAIQAHVQVATKDLSTVKQRLSVELAKQKIIFELFAIFSVTILVYIVMGSSEYVHIVAVTVLILGILYVLTYNAYRLRTLGNDIGSPTLASLGDMFKGSSQPTTLWPSFFSPPNADGPTATPPSLNTGVIPAATK